MANSEPPGGRERSEKRQTSQVTRAWPPLFAYGFRPFFLLAPLFAAIAIPAWMAMHHSLPPASGGLAPLAWHAHEMLFGFACAAIAGFLLTAVPSWTGRRGFAGLPLFLLVLLWLAGRLSVILPGGATDAWIAVIDLAFLPALAVTLLPALLRDGKRRNLVFIPLLALLFTANLQFHLDAAQSVEPLRLGLNTILFLLTLLGGRIIPAFTSAALKERGHDMQVPRAPILGPGLLLAVGAVLAVDLLFPGGVIAGSIAATAAALLALQLCRWHGHRCLGDPLLWVLHAAYAWLPVSLLLKSAALFGLAFPENTWVHALTVGAMATMIIGVMSRAALGHTGRALVAPPVMSFAYVALIVAALLRVFGPLLHPPAILWWHWLSAGLWSLAFLVFIVVYAPILTRPRIDGKPG